MTRAVCFPDVRDAVRDANAAASIRDRARVVSYVQGRGWMHYDPVDEVPGGFRTPEFLCLGSGRVPLPIGEHAAEVWLSAVTAAPQTRKDRR